MPYKTIIHTDQYKDRKATKKNWEPGTMNDFMHALNLWSSTEKSLKEVWWRIYRFQHSVGAPNNAYDNQGHKTAEYEKWAGKKENSFCYNDKLCGIVRNGTPSGYGFMQGYVDIDAKIKKLRMYGYVRIYFHELYDGRQYLKNMDGCYMEIYRISRMQTKEELEADYLSAE